MLISAGDLSGLSGFYIHIFLLYFFFFLMLQFSQQSTDSIPIIKSADKEKQDLKVR